MPVEAFDKPDQLRDFLTQDRVGNAYLLGDLDPAYLPFCDWFGFVEEDEIKALVLVYKGLSLPAVLTVGPKDPSRAHQCLDELFDKVKDKLPNQFWIHAVEPHRPALVSHFKAGDLQRMIRMSLKKEDYNSKALELPVRRLDHSDTAAIMALYQHFPDNFFEPYQLETGLYFGIEKDDSEGLAAIAGIHVFSETYDIAAIGNLVTHPDYRRRSYATAVTTRLLSELFESVSLVTLNVQEGNLAAIGTYEKFGFSHHHVYYEGRVSRSEKG
jgi:ribosomal protein S18 acetylase RimI-like enzyme